jgi:hypothetical protein
VSGGGSTEDEVAPAGRRDRRAYASPVFVRSRAIVSIKPVEVDRLDVEVVAPGRQRLLAGAAQRVRR